MKNKNRNIKILAISLLLCFSFVHLVNATSKNVTPSMVNEVLSDARFGSTMADNVYQQKAAYTGALVKMLGLIASSKGASSSSINEIISDAKFGSTMADNVLQQTASYMANALKMAGLVANFSGISTENVNEVLSDARFGSTMANTVHQQTAAYTGALVINEIISDARFGSTMADNVLQQTASYMANALKMAGLVANFSGVSTENVNEVLSDARFGSTMANTVHQQTAAYTGALVKILQKNQTNISLKPTARTGVVFSEGSWRGGLARRYRAEQSSVHLAG